MGFHRFAFTLTLLATAALTPSFAEAQWRPMYPGYPNPYYRYAEPEADLKFDVTPKDASIYVDGYFAGRVDDYDGAFQRLHVSPGQHEIVVYLEGFHSLRQQLYLSPNRTRKIEGDLEKLAAGSQAEPIPTPSERPREANRDRDPDEANRPPLPRRALRPRDRELPPPDREGATTGTSTSATLSIRVQPGGATVLIDGEQWQGPSDSNERLLVQVGEGRHTVEVSRQGYERFVTEIDVRRGQTEPVNVSLVRSR